MSPSGSRLGSVRRRIADDERDDDGPESWFERLREWSITGAIAKAVRERAGPIVIQVGRKARVPYDVASDPDVHITAKWSMSRRAADNGDPRDHRNIDLDRPCRRDERGRRR